MTPILTDLLNDDISKNSQSVSYEVTNMETADNNANHDSFE